MAASTATTSPVPASAGFYAVNDGLSISETNFLGASAVHEGDVMVGLQDNGIGARASGAVWRVVIVADGGGIVREPDRPERWIAQYTNGTWSTPAGYSMGGPLAWAAAVATSRANSTENDAAAFYTLPASIGHTRGGAKIGQFLIGTTRPWYTDDNGTTWCTLPTATDARSVVAGVVDLEQRAGRSRQPHLRVPLAGPGHRVAADRQCDLPAVADAGLAPAERAGDVDDAGAQGARQERARDHRRRQGEEAHAAGPELVAGAAALVAALARDRGQLHSRGRRCSGAVGAVPRHDRPSDRRQRRHAVVVRRQPTG